jgi:Mg2+ and Co2+ transporter CorA
VNTVIVNSFQINDALQLTPLAPGSAAEACQSKDARIWIDLEAAEPGDIEAWLGTLGITGLSRQLFLDARDHSGFYPLKKEIFFVIPVLTDSEGSPNRDYAAFFCRENLLLTLHAKPILKPQEIATLDQADDWLPDRSVAGLVSAAMMDLSQACLRHIGNLRRSILVLEKRMDREPDTVDAEEILDMRSDLLVHEAVVSDQLPTAKALCATDKPFFELKNAQEYLNCVLVNLQAADRSLDRLGERIGALRAGFQMHAQDKTKPQARHADDSVGHLYAHHAPGGNLGYEFRRHAGAESSILLSHGARPHGPDRYWNVPFLQERRMV